MISLIVPVFNGEQYLSKCLESLNSQDLSDFELILVDNASTDGTKEIAKAFCNNKSLRRYFYCEKKGVSAARNMGLEKAEGEYVFFLDSDDMLAAGALKKLSEAAFKTGADIVVSNILCTEGETSYLRDPDAGDGGFIYKNAIPLFVSEKLDTYLNHNVFKLYKKSVLYNIRFDESLSLGEDLLFNLKAFEAAESLYYINQPLYIHDASGGGLNRKRRKNLAYVKTFISGELKAYLVKNNVLRPTFGLTLMNDVFALIVNEVPEKGGVRKVLKLDITREMLQSGIFRKLDLKKKLVWICIKLKLAFILTAAVRRWEGIHE